MCEQFVQTLMISLGLFCNTHTGEECELTCRDNNSDVVILLSNMTADSMRKEHWRNPPKVKVCVCVCVCLLQVSQTYFTKHCCS